jgi:hypothetical protein
MVGAAPAGAGAAPAGAGDAVTLHSSWRGIGAAVASGVLLTGLGSWAMVASDFRVLPTVIAGVGVVLLVVALLDYPVASTFDVSGVRRRMVLRRQWLPWHRVKQLSRTRPALVRGPRPLRPGGLIAVVGRRRYLLVDQVESPAEFDALLAVLAPLHDELALVLVNRPPDATVPTWTYRRAKWAPASGRDAR